MLKLCLLGKMESATRQGRGWGEQEGGREGVWEAPCELAEEWKRCWFPPAAARLIRSEWEVGSGLEGLVIMLMSYREGRLCKVHL